MIGKQHLSPCDTWRTEPRQDDGYRVFEWAHGPNHRALENDYHRWLRRTHTDIYQGIFPDKGANENTEYSNRARTGTPIDHVPKEAHYSHWVAERAIDFIDHDREEPFFLMVNFFDPHHSFGAPQEYRDLIDADAIPVPVTKPGELDEKPKDHREYSEKSYGGTSPGFQDYTAAEIKEIRAQYWAMIALIDYEVGRILAVLEEAGHGQNTLVVFTSDHGEMLGNHQQLLKGPQLYDDLCRVPLIARWPEKIAAATSFAHPVQWIDLTATILDASGCAPGAGVQGQSLMPMLAGQNVAFRPWAMCEYRDSGFPSEPAIMTTMLRYKNWKLIVWHGAPACGNTRDGELYDLEADPGELHNLFHAPDHAKQRRLMKERMLAAMADAEDLTQRQARPW
jgi:arylsulfatase A-like enzyme